MEKLILRTLAVAALAAPSRHISQDHKGQP